MVNVLFLLFVSTSAVLKVAGERTLIQSQIGFGVQKLKNTKSKGVLQQVESTSCENVKQYWFKEAVLDNFAPVENQQHWAGDGQRYWINKDLWGGVDFPIFVFIGGEGEESCSRLTDYLYMYNLAQENKGLLVDVEHRFYGQSYPTEDMSTESYKYLNADQALADLARLIGKIKKDLNTVNSKVITLSGSYPGSLAAWFRLKYPSVTAGSIASSAPVNAQTNFPEYMEVVAKAMLQYSGQGCYDAFETAALKVAQLARQGPGSSGVTQLEVDFHTCHPIDTQQDIGILLSDLMGNIQGTVQYNNVIAGSTNMADVCDVMLASSDPYTQFVQLQTQYRAANGQSCEDANWTDSIAYLSAVEKDHTNMARPWTYQTCNEFGFFQTADSEVYSAGYKSLCWT